MARNAWIARRSEARRRARIERARAARRLLVVGRVRLVGKGPPPRDGPLPFRPELAIIDEPMDSPMLAIIDECVEHSSDMRERLAFMNLAKKVGAA